MMLRSKGLVSVGGRLQLRHSLRRAAVGTTTRSLSSLPAPGVQERIILGVETSCDDTSVGAVRFTSPPLEVQWDGSKRVVPVWTALPPTALATAAAAANVVASQHTAVSARGGVMPLEAAAAHEHAMQRVMAAALAQAGVVLDRDTGRQCGGPPVAAVAVTVCPGLALCLKVGLAAAATLAQQLQVPLLPIHHLEAHLLVPRLPSPSTSPSPSPPAQPAAAAAAAAAVSAAAVSAAAVSAAAVSAVPAAPATSTAAMPALTPPFPYLVLLISGGHTQVMLALSPARYVHCGATADDSIGEAFDKVARLLLPLQPQPQAQQQQQQQQHGGAALEQLALRGRVGAVSLPVPLHAGAAAAKQRASLAAAYQRAQSLDLRCATTDGSSSAGTLRSVPDVTEDLGVCAFSFSGLKSAVSRVIQQQLQAQHEAPAAADVAAAFQHAVSRHLCEQLEACIRWCQHLTATGKLDLPSDGSGLHVVVAGGAAANQYLRAQLTAMCRGHGVTAVFPPPALCTDNGLMIAWAGLERLVAGPPPSPTPAPAATATATATTAAAGADHTWWLVPPQRAHEVDFAPKWRLGQPLPPWRTG